MQNKKQFIKIIKKQAFILGIWSLGAVAGASIINWYYLIPTLQPETVFEQGDWVNGDKVAEDKPEMAESMQPDRELVQNQKAPEESTRLEGDSRSVIVTTYNPTEAQTDSDPFTMASGKRVYEGAIASNCHPIGTKLEIEGLGTMTVEDRMNSRYTKDCGTENERLDIFKWKKEDNFKKTVKYAKV